MCICGAYALYGCIAIGCIICCCAYAGGCCPYCCGYALGYIGRASLPGSAIVEPRFSCIGDWLDSGLGSAVVFSS